MLFATTSESFPKIKSKKSKRASSNNSDRTIFPASPASQLSSDIPASDLSPQAREEIITAALWRAQLETSSSSCASNAISSAKNSSLQCLSHDTLSRALDNSSEFLNSSTLTAVDFEAMSKKTDSTMSSGKKSAKNLSKFKINSKGQYCPWNAKSPDSNGLEDDDTLKDVEDATLSEELSTANSENSAVHQMKIKSRNILVLKQLEDEMRKLDQLENLHVEDDVCLRKTEFPKNLPVEKPKVIIKAKLELAKNEKLQREKLVSRVLKDMNDKKYFVMPPKKSTYEDWKKLKDEETKAKNVEKERERQASEEQRKKQAELNRIAFSRWYEQAKNKPRPPPIMPSKYLAPTVTQSGPSLNWNPVPWIDNWAENDDGDYVADQRFKNVSKSDTQTNVDVNGKHRSNPRMAGRPYTKSDFLVRTMLESRFSTKAFLLGERWMQFPTGPKALTGNAQRVTQSNTKTNARKMAPLEVEGKKTTKNAAKTKIPPSFNSMKCIAPSSTSNVGTLGKDSVTKKRINANTQSSTQWKAPVGRDSCSRSNIQSDTKFVVFHNDVKGTSDRADKVSVCSRKTRINVGKR